MKRLYKYLPRKYEASYLRGEILFRNLCDFMYSEDIARADAFEGSHVDWPKGGGKLQNLSTGKPILGEWAMRRSLARPDKYFLHCTSTKHNEGLYSKFGDTCIEIIDPDEFSSRLRAAIIDQVAILDRSSIRFDQIEYYSPQQSQTVRSIEDAANLPFFKPDKFSDEAEYRFGFSRPRGLNVLMQATIPEYDRLKEFQKNRSWRNKLIKIGDISDITVTHHSSAAHAA